VAPYFLSEFDGLRIYDWLQRRKNLLTQMLSIQEEPWLNLDTLSKTIGASPEETKRLLFEIGARGSET